MYFPKRNYETDYFKFGKIIFQKYILNYYLETKKFGFYINEEKEDKNDNKEKPNDGNKNGDKKEKNYVSWILVGILGLAVLVLIIVEFALKKPAMRFFAFIVMLALIVLAFLAGLFYFIQAVRFEAGWYRCVEPWIEYMLLPIVVCFGYLYFSGAPKKA